MNRKVRLLARKGTNKAGSVVEYSVVEADWLIKKGYAEPVADKKAPESEPSDSDGAASPVKARASRGRPRKES